MRKVIGSVGNQRKPVEDTFYRRRDGEHITGASNDIVRHGPVFWRHRRGGRPSSIESWQNSLGRSSTSRHGYSTSTSTVGCDDHLRSRRAPLPSGTGNDRARQKIFRQSPLDDIQKYRNQWKLYYCGSLWLSLAGLSGLAVPFWPVALLSFIYILDFFLRKTVVAYLPPALEPQLSQTHLSGVVVRLSPCAFNLT